MRCQPPAYGRYAPAIHEVAAERTGGDAVEVMNAHEGLTATRVPARAWARGRRVVWANAASRARAVTLGALRRSGNASLPRVVRRERRFTVVVKRPGDALELRTVIRHRLT